MYFALSLCRFCLDHGPWIRSRQEQLEADVQRAWADDPVIASQMAGTKQVQFLKGRVN